MTSNRLHRLIVQLIKAWYVLFKPSLWSFAIAGTFPTAEHRSFPFPQEPRVVLDVGANRGQFALFALAKWKKCKVHMFEPLPSCQDSLRKVWQKFPHRTRIHQVALGEKPGKIPFYETTSSDNSSPLVPTSEHQAGSIHREIAVPSDTLDNQFTVGDESRPLLLKLDVQGYEREVVLGAKVILQEADLVIVELSQAEFYEGQALSQEIDCLLREYNLTRIAHRPSAWSADGEWSQADALYIRNSTGDLHPDS